MWDAVTDAVSGVASLPSTLASALMGPLEFHCVSQRKEPEQLDSPRRRQHSKPSMTPIDEEPEVEAAATKSSRNGGAPLDGDELALVFGALLSQAARPRLEASTPAATQQQQQHEERLEEGGYDETSTTDVQISPSSSSSSADAQIDADAAPAQRTQRDLFGSTSSQGFPDPPEDRRSPPTRPPAQWYTVDGSPSNTAHTPSKGVPRTNTALSEAETEQAMSPSDREAQQQREDSTVLLGFLQQLTSPFDFPSGSAAAPAPAPVGPPAAEEAASDETPVVGTLRRMLSWPRQKAAPASDGAAAAQSPRASAEDPQAASAEAEGPAPASSAQDQAEEWLTQNAVALLAAADSAEEPSVAEEQEEQGPTEQSPPEAELEPARSQSLPVDQQVRSRAELIRQRSIGRKNLSPLRRAIAVPSRSVADQMLAAAPAAEPPAPPQTPERRAAPGASPRKSNLFSSPAAALAALRRLGSRAPDDGASPASASHRTPPGPSQPAVTPDLVWARVESFLDPRTPDAVRHRLRAQLDALVSGAADPAADPDDGTPARRAQLQWLERTEEYERTEDLAFGV